ncbi:MAG: VWA domain-containing protein [Candidatus Nanopelagicales bacterium]
MSDAPTQARADLAAVAAAFGDRLHAAGVPVTPERSARFAASVLLSQPTTMSEAYWLGRVTLLSSQAHIPVYDVVFDEAFRGYLDLTDPNAETIAPEPSRATPSEEDFGAEQSVARDTDSIAPVTSATPGSRTVGDSDDDRSVLAAASASEILGHRDFSECSPEELALLRRLVEELPLIPPSRRARRSHRHPAGRRLDVRATLRRAHRTGGDPVRRIHRRRTQRPRRVVLIADVSGSMEPYARVYLHLMRGAVRALGAESFVFATRLTRLTRQLAQGGPDYAYAKVSEATPDWSGGTRIGAALTRFLDEHGRRGIARGAVVVIVSDGWEIGDPVEVGRAMERLSRLAHHIIWVNPRSAARDFKPLAGGMAAALPYVDTFLSGHSVDALKELLDAIRAAG